MSDGAAPVTRGRGACESMRRKGTGQGAMADAERAFAEQRRLGTSKLASGTVPWPQRCGRNTSQRGKRSTVGIERQQQHRGQQLPDGHRGSPTIHAQIQCSWRSVWGPGLRRRTDDINRLKAEVSRLEQQTQRGQGEFTWGDGYAGIVATGAAKRVACPWRARRALCAAAEAQPRPPSLHHHTHTHAPPPGCPPGWIPQAWSMSGTPVCGAGRERYSPKNKEL